MKFVHLLALVACTAATNAIAFHLNPANRSPSSTSDDKHFLNKISEPVHEALTRKAREVYWGRCHKESESGPGCLKADVPKAIDDSLIRGVWWSDDPNQDLYKARHATWLGHMFDAERRAKGGRHIDDKYMMHYRSHYGDMQFLHSMASEDGEEASTTRRNIFMWAEFLYQVATNKLRKETKFRAVSVGGLPGFFKRQADWDLQWILQPRYRLKRPDDFGEHGLGILLHMVQDSYSAAHVERIFTPTARCRTGYINRFLSYTHQRSSKHGKADTWVGYEASKLPPEANPVDAGAQLIWFARHDADWNKEVLPYLDATVFCLAENPQAAGPGSY